MIGKRITLAATINALKNVLAMPPNLPGQDRQRAAAVDDAGGALPGGHPALAVEDAHRVRRHDAQQLGAGAGGPRARRHRIWRMLSLSEAGFRASSLCCLASHRH